MINVADVKYMLKNIIKTGAQNNIHSVAVFWSDNLGFTNRRVGYFEDYVEAELFAKMLKQTYEDLCEYIIYVNSNIYADNIYFAE